MTSLRTAASLPCENQIVLEVIDDIVDEIFFEIMVGPEAFEVVPQVKVVLDRLAVSRHHLSQGRAVMVAVEKPHG